MEPLNQNQLAPLPDSRLKSLLLILIFTLIASGAALICLKFIQDYHREQLYIATEAALPVHKIEKAGKPVSESAGKLDDTSDWKTYRNEEYGFEFKYPSRLKEEDYSKNQDKNNLLVCFGPEKTGGYFCLTLRDQPLIKSSIKSLYNGIVEIDGITETQVANKITYYFNDGHAACGGPDYRISLNEKQHLSIRFVNCDPDEPYIQGGEITQILSTFKFIE